jgi:hypothetical protein
VALPSNPSILGRLETERFGPGMRPIAAEVGRNDRSNVGAAVVLPIWLARIVKNFSVLIPQPLLGSSASTTPTWVTSSETEIQNDGETVGEHPRGRMIHSPMVQQRQGNSSRATEIGYRTEYRLLMCSDYQCVVCWAAAWNRTGEVLCLWVFETSEQWT